jgi:hypothetical protein
VRHRTLLITLLALALPAAAHAQQREVRAVVHQQLVALLNPMGAEHTVRAALRAPLGDPDELLFTGAHAETGVVNYLSPVYAITGGYLEVSPLAFLVLRSEFTGTAMWPLGMEGSGYYGLTSYTDDVRPQALPAELGGSATGWNVTLSARLQGMIPIGPVRLLVLDQLTGDHATLGDAPYYYNLKHDLVLAQQDWVLKNDAVVLVETDLAPTTQLRLGAYDDLRVVPRSGYVGHQVGLLAMLTFQRPLPEISELGFFLRGGYYTHHVTRAEELTVLGGVSVSYDIGAIR